MITHTQWLPKVA